ncbi:MAG: gamma-glutamyl-gamma-aminobutyrate hydrolase family protein [Candidatus Nomurabacteria bacterium]|jgi:GMP synthase-like glutamine amidotransferase|nr:gamma-glutamyl-gamma-aminobutyrate hydrolase family protein [Candidatus Nomurabacteria bacterium]
MMENFSWPQPRLVRRVVIVNNGTKFIGQLDEFVKRQLPGLEHKIIPVEKLAPAQLRADDLLILSGGSRWPVWHNRKIFATEDELVRQHSGVIIGICLGFQVIAHSYGSGLHRSLRRVQGEHKIYTDVNGDDLIPGGQATVFESHRFYIKNCPAQFRQLAHSRRGVELIAHRLRPLVGMQFHPERLAAEFPDGAKIFRRILSRLVKLN